MDSSPLSTLNCCIKSCKLFVNLFKSSAALAICCVPDAVSCVTFVIDSIFLLICSAADDCSSLAAATCVIISDTFTTASIICCNASPAFCANVIPTSTSELIRTLKI